MENTNNSQPTAVPDNGKTVAIVSYITLIGWIIALIMHSSHKTRLGAYHLRQMLGLIILGVAIAILSIPLIMIPFLGWGILWVLRVGILVLWLMGLIAAANGEEKPTPIVGVMFQKWFAGLGV
jgi:uncharacterized membrane protein